MNKKVVLTNLLIVALMFFFSSSSCKKKVPEKYALHPEITEFLDFKEGSYWIYKNIISERLDCSYVFNYNKGFYIESEAGESYTGERADYEHVEYKQSWFSNNVTIGLNPAIIPNEVLYYKGNYQFKDDTGRGDGGNLLFYKNESYNYLDSLILLGGWTYENVIKIRSTHPIFKTAYLKRHVGFVKFELPDSSVYELIRYNVVQ